MFSEIFVLFRTISCNRTYDITSQKIITMDNIHRCEDPKHEMADACTVMSRCIVSIIYCFHDDRISCTCLDIFRLCK